MSSNLINIKLNGFYEAINLVSKWCVDKILKANFFL